MEGDKEFDLDAMLDSALEDFEALDRQSHVPTNPNPSTENQSNQANVTPEQFAEVLQGLGSQKLEEDPEAFLESLLNQFESNNSYTGMVEGMMKQLISKEILYEPMKEMYDKYPTWLEENKANLPENDYTNYLKQFGFIEQIIYIYDSKGDDGLDEVLKLMQEMQECGQVPVDIVKQLAPEVEFDDQGLPKFPNGGLPGGLPGGIPGLPPGMDPNQCSIS